MSAGLHREVARSQDTQQAPGWLSPQNWGWCSPGARGGAVIPAGKQGGLFAACIGGKCSQTVFSLLGVIQLCFGCAPSTTLGGILVSSTPGSTALCWSHRHELGDDGCWAPHHGKTHQDKKGPKMKKLEVKRIEGSSSSCNRPGAWQHQWAEEIQGEAPQKREGLAGSQCRRRRSFFPLLANIIMLYINTKCQNVSQLNGSLACTQKEDDKC